MSTRDSSQLGDAAIGWGDKNIGHGDPQNTENARKALGLCVFGVISWGRGGGTRTGGGNRTGGGTRTSLRPSALPEPPKSGGVWEQEHVLVPLPHR